ncbi:DUF6266 family protein [Flavobacterium silvaticum]|uniref:Uncharacterized protein n=1 Tax=Flavobacterium silvaticum TaxID=1852020 RepID=A0A972FIV4_9FLAO|nr:DUF6266 family protein [Flavobacterium silvaticum]NMH26568.1 hypothetical protein [Flavobacterium silvaticum]
MGTFEKGILGPFSGKVGTVVGANWRGLNVMRSLPRKSSQEATLAQKIVREKFSLVVRFLKPLRPIVSAYYGHEAGELSRYNLATAYHINEAIVGTYPDLTLDYNLVIISSGELLNVENPAMATQPNAELAFTWTDNSGQTQANASDGFVVVVYNQTIRKSEYRDLAALRSAGSFTFNLPNSWIGDTVHAWVAMATSDRLKYSSSVYLGQAVLA